MIINVRGTSGSGKSTIVRKVMEKYANRTPIKTPKKRKPIGYYLEGHDADPAATLVVFGHYETECGGCDTISGRGMRDLIDSMVRKCHELGHDVLYEGLILGGERWRTVKLAKEGLPVLVINLTTDIEECLRCVQKRREARGTKTPLNPRNTILKKKEVDHASKTCAENGVDVQELNRDDALEIVESCLGLM